MAPVTTTMTVKAATVKTVTRTTKVKVKVTAAAPMRLAPVPPGQRWFGQARRQA
jgi:hypothetical protein